MFAIVGKLLELVSIGQWVVGTSVVGKAIW